MCTRGETKMIIKWCYNDYEFELKISELTRTQLDRIIEFLEEFEEEKE